VIDLGGALSTTEPNRKPLTLCGAGLDQTVLNYRVTHRGDDSGAAAWRQNARPPAGRRYGPMRARSIPGGGGAPSARGASFRALEPIDVRNRLLRLMAATR